MPSDWHEHLVETLVGEGWERSGFDRALAELWFEINDEDPEYDDGLPNLRPDAWRIDRPAQGVYVAEVDTSCFLTPGKWARLTYVAFHLDCVDWDLILVRVDAFGNRNEFRVIEGWLSENWQGLPTSEPSRNPRFWVDPASRYREEAA